MYKIKQFFRRIYNLYRWLPIIWKDQDWDDFYIFEILKFKLKNQAEYIDKRGIHLSAKRDAEIMMLCVRLIEKIQDEYYGTEYFGYYKSYLEFKKLKNSELFEISETITSEALDGYFKKYPLIYKKVYDKNSNKGSIAFRMGRINEERAHKLLFKILEQNIKRWWD
jgi:hypothetical protein